ncbi:MAG: 3-(3-hydroxy-phenyl)propionate/3-hydroxycinnamic acid hydroxylase [Pseudomonadota bacterium]
MTPDASSVMTEPIRPSVRRGPLSAFEANADRPRAFDTEVDVAIIGLGPVGATLAGLLACCGLTVAVLERDPEIYRLPRAVHFDGECMRVFQTLGLAMRLEERLIVSPGMKFIDADGRLLIDWSRPRQMGPQGWYPSYRFHQPDLDHCLRANLHEQPCISQLLRCEVFSLREHADHVEICYEDLANGRLCSLRAAYVVGCDGARSLVRRFIGSELYDLHSHQRWLVLDLLLKRDRPDLGDHSVQFCDPRRPATYVRGVGERRRWEFMLMPGDDPQQLITPHSVWGLLAPWLSPDDASIERQALYTFHAAIARQWRRDRLLIAGDAAHQTPPFMGQGMCAGIRDAANLAWKLAAVLKDGATPDLLDTYESERLPHVQVFVETAVRLGHIIQATDEQAVRARDEHMSAHPSYFATPDPPLGKGAHQAGKWGGRLSQQPLLADERRFDDRVGYRFALVHDANLDPRELQRRNGDTQFVCADEDALAHMLGALGARAVLIRPDRYIAGTADSADELAQLMTRYALDGSRAG